MAIKIDEELQNSPTVNLILDAVLRYSNEALEKLVNTDPTNAGLVSALQARVKYGRFINERIDYIRKDGILAQVSLEEEGKVDLNEDSQNR